MPKPRSATAAAKKPISPADVEALADALVDKPYGDAPAIKPLLKSAAVSVKAKPITISLPPSIIEQLEDAALSNKRGGNGPKTVSAIVRAALAAAGYD
ncbi:MAG: hypothetical protein K2Y25_15955 [Pseudomonadaceae bacterium]|nr:hypothetical protein [Pseudomonadaceae bacterium]